MWCSSAQNYQAALTALFLPRAAGERGLTAVEREVLKIHMSTYSGLDSQNYTALNEQ